MKMGVGTHSKADCTDRLNDMEQTSSIASDVKHDEEYQSRPPPLSHRMEYGFD